MLSRTAVSGTLVLVVVVAACGGQEPAAKPPPPPAAPIDPAVIATAAKACARVSACTPAEEAPKLRDPGACVGWWVGGESPTLRACLEKASSCDAVKACIHGGGDARAAQFCAERPGVVSGCDGDRLISCGEDDAHESSVVDCAAIGGTCREVRASGGLVVRACASAAKCPPGGPEVRCDGTGAVISCRDGAYERIACAAGTKCEEHKDEVGEAAASCELPGQKRCLGDRRGVSGVRRCEDDRLVACDGGKTKVTDCVGQGLRCAGVGPRAGCYVPSNVECDPGMAPRCEGSSVVFCAAGRLEKISCASIGLGVCDPAAKGPFAACAPAPPK